MTTWATATPTPTAPGVWAATPASGPAFFSVDLRLNREIPLTENWTLGLIAEAFNLSNRTNFKNINSTVGDLRIDELPSRQVGRRGPVTEPFSFTSAFDPRQFQLSVRLNF